MVTQHLILRGYAKLTQADEAALTELDRRGTPASTLRAVQPDLVYISAWKMEAFGKSLIWPEDERVALTCPAPATLDRRIACWQAFHRMHNLTWPFSAPLVQQARQKGTAGQCMATGAEITQAHHARRP